jgi:hypothetical protein
VGDKGLVSPGDTTEPPRHCGQRLAGRDDGAKPARERAANLGAVRFSGVAEADMALDDGVSVPQRQRAGNDLGCEHPSFSRIGLDAHEPRKEVPLRARKVSQRPALDMFLRKTVQTDLTKSRRLPAVRRRARAATVPSSARFQPYWCRCSDPG